MSDLPMAQEDHPAHNIPEPTEPHYGESHGIGAKLADRRDQGKSTRAPLDEAMPVSPQGVMNVE